MEQLLTDSEPPPDWERVRPVLDEAMEDLSDQDREAVLLRYFKNHDFHAVGRALGVSEDAAQKRVSRAVERLREFFAKRGVAVGASGLAVLLSANAVQAAPIGLSGTIATATALQSTATIAAQTIAMTTLQKTLAIVIVAASLTAPLLVQRQAEAKTREQEEALRQSTGQLAKLQSESDGLSNQLARATASPASSSPQFNEVLRLRGEVGRLQANLRELTGSNTNAPLSREEALASMQQLYADRVSRLKQRFAEHPEQSVPELKYLPEQRWLELVQYDHHQLDPDGTIALSSVRSSAQIDFGMRVLTPALWQYGKAHHGQFPTDLSQLAPYFKTPVDNAVLQNWAILPTSSLPESMRLNEPQLITQKAAINPEHDQRIVIGMKGTQFGSGPNQWSDAPRQP